MDNHQFNCPHDHDFLSERQQHNERRTWFVIFLTLVTMIVEIFSGLLFGSMALLADGWHMASHASAMGITALAYYLARKHRHNEKFSFGTGKIGDLAGYSSALLLALIALFMAYESVKRLLYPVNIRFNEAIVVAVIGLVVNVASALILKDRHDHHETTPTYELPDHDHNIRAAYLHVLADALTSILAITALALGKVWGWSFLDPVMGIAGALVISRWSYGLLRDTGEVLLDYNTHPHMVEGIRRTIESDGDTTVQDLHMWRVGPGRYGIILALTSSDGTTPASLKQRLRGFRHLAHVTIEVNRPGETCRES